MFNRHIAHCITLLQFAKKDDEAAADEAPEFVLPEDLSTLDDEALAALLAQANEAFDAMRDGELTADVVSNLELLAAAIDTIKAEQTTREGAAAALQERADALAAQVHGTEGEGGEGEGADGAADGATTEGAGDGAAGEGAGDAGATEAGADGAAAAATGDAAAVEGGEGAEATGDAVVVAAGAKRTGPIRVPLARVREHAPQVNVGAADERVVILAAADVPGAAMGTELDPRGAARAMHAKARNLGEGHSALVASVHHPDLGDDLTLREADSVDTITEKLNNARQVESLVAAGGWCTPSQFMYDLFSIEGSDGLLDLPTVNVDRGGIQFVENGGPSIADVWTAPWLWTEAMDIAAGGNPHVDPDDDVSKPCVRVPCPEWVEERLDAHGICLTHGNLGDRAYPELTRRFLNLLMAAHAHIVNTRVIAAVQAEATAVPIAATFGAASALESAIDLQASDYRDKFRMNDTAILEAVFPRWVRGVLRADISRRNGQPYETVTNQQIAANFAARQIRPQFIYDYQPLQTGAGGADGFREVWPDSVEFLMYAAGTFVKGQGGSIDLSVARDSTLNAVNDHTVAFTEEFLLVAKMGHEARKITVPVEPNGATGGQVAVAAIGA